MRPIVIIDGNNLAHQKYFFEGRDVPLNIFERMAVELESWAKAEDCLVELCLDPCAMHPKTGGPVSIYVDNKKADDLVEERALYHAYQGHPCIAITIDGMLSDTVRELGVQCVTSTNFSGGRYGFMPLPSISNVKKLLPDEEKLPVNYPTDHHEQHKKIKSIPNKTELEEIYKRTLQNVNSFGVRSDESVIIKSPETYYAVNITNWPIKKGVEFILESACSDHKNVLKDLIGDVDKATQQDLLILFQTWCEYCCNESNFISRGGALMDRVRLALIKKYPESLTLVQISELVSGNVSGLRKKIKKYSPDWILEVPFPDTKK